jgi:ketosteroid isomerase-like protein
LLDSLGGRSCGTTCCARTGFERSEAVVDVVMIAEFNDDGKVTRINEYLDSAALAPLTA